MCDLHTSTTGLYAHTPRTTLITYAIILQITHSVTTIQMHNTAMFTDIIYICSYLFVYMQIIHYLV